MATDLLPFGEVDAILQLVGELGLELVEAALEELLARVLRRRDDRHVLRVAGAACAPGPRATQTARRASETFCQIQWFRSSLPVRSLTSNNSELLK